MASMFLSLTRRTLALGAAMAFLASSPVATRAGDAPRVGAPAPAFQAADADGRLITSAALAGKTIVLEWTNPECPYVAKHYLSGAMQALQAEMTSRGVVWLSISSAAPGQVGYLDALEAGALVDARKAKSTHFLLDHDGRMLADYAVPVALTMAVIAPNGALAYYGAIDDKPSAKLEDIPGARNYVRAALETVARGEKPSPAQTRPYGCVAR
jgi:hypothetical protein